MELFLTADSCPRWTDEQLKEALEDTLSYCSHHLVRVTRYADRSADVKISAIYCDAVRMADAYFSGDASGDVYKRQDPDRRGNPSDHLVLRGHHHQLRSPLKIPPGRGKPRPNQKRGGVLQKRAALLCNEPPLRAGVPESL